MKDQQKQIDPALKLCVGVHCMIIDNNGIAKGRANGTFCRLVGVKRNCNTSLQWKNDDNEKSIREFEHFQKKIEQKHKSITDKVSRYFTPILLLLAFVVFSF